MEYRYERCESVSKPIIKHVSFRSFGTNCVPFFYGHFWRKKNKNELKLTDSWLLVNKKGHKKVTDVFLSAKCQT